MIHYSDLPGVNFSTLKHMAVSPRHYRHACDTDREDTKAFGLGRACHSAILEPERFRDETVICSLSRATEAWKRLENVRSLPSLDDLAICTTAGARKGKAWDAFAADNAGKLILLPSEWEQIGPLVPAMRRGVEIISQEEYDVAVAVSKNVWADADAVRLLKDGQMEAPIAWIDAETGIRCKGRLDCLQLLSVGELKTARDIRPRRFGWQASELGYFAQLAFYADGADVQDAWIITCESSPPYDVVTYPHVPDAAIETGRERYREWLARLVECRERDEWPGISGGCGIEMELPDRAMGVQQDAGLDMSGVEEVVT